MELPPHKPIVFNLNAFTYLTAAGVLGYSSELLRNNTGPDYSNGESFFTVFGVFFPTACGVLSGINMSGDLRNPRKAIAQGTIAATALRYNVYRWLHICACENVV